MIDINHASFNDAADWWRHEVGVNVIPACTRNKRPKVEWKQFQDKPIPPELHDFWKKEGMFNDGIMIIPGKIWHNDRKKSLYLIALDFDNKRAIDEFCSANSTESLQKLADSMLIEQHADDETRAHIFFYSKRPYEKLNRTSDSKVPQIEVKGTGEHGVMCVTPSPHKNGTKYEIIGDSSAFVDEVQIHDNIDKHIDSILSKYDIPYLFESDNGDKNRNNNATDGFFKFNPDEKIKKGSRHNFLIKYANSLIRRLRKSTPLDAIKISVEYVNKTYFEEPLPDKEVEQIFNDCVDFISKQIDEVKDQVTSSFPEIANNIHYQLSKMPPKYIVAFKDTKQVTEVTIKPKSKEKGGFSTDTLYLSDNTTYLACIPTRIVRHKNPLAFLQTTQKYTMTFIDKAEEKLTFRQKTLAEIVQQLRDLGKVLSDGADKALNALLQAYIENKFIEDNEETDYIGFFKDKQDGTIFASNVEIKEPSLSKLVDAINFLANELKVHYDGRLDLLATSIVWGMAAPVIYMLKTNNYFLKALHFYGFANATKSNTGKIILALDGHDQDSKFAMQLPSVDTLPKLGAAVSHSTFPILIDEMDLSDPYNAWLINDLKSLIESNLARKKWANSKASGPIEIPSLSCLILTSNAPPPFHNSGYMRRVITRNFPQSETWKENDPKAVQFKEFLRVNLPRLKPLGDFRNWYIMNYQAEILDEKRPDPLHLGLKILKSAFEYADIQIPSWLLQDRIPENQLEESIQDNEVIVKRAFEKYIDEQVNRALQVWKLKLDKEEKLELPNDISDRLVKLAESNLLPDIKYAPLKQGINIRSGILTELYNHGVTRDQLPNLRALADYMNAEFIKSDGKKIVFADKHQLDKYFDVKNE